MSPAALPARIASAGSDPARRRLLLGAAALTAGAPALHGCSDSGYAEAVRHTWQDAPRPAPAGSELHRELVRYATLAPSSHNTQCWKFRIEADAISILPDASRRCPVVDPDDHHLYASLGCAAENLVQAALAHGMRADAGFDEAADAVRIRLAPAAPVASPLFQAIPRRQCTRGEYDGRPVPPAELDLLAAAGRGEGVEVLLLTGAQALEEILGYVVQGNSAQFNDPAFVAELKEWMRFSEAAAVAHRDGLFSAASGNPTGPQWLGRLIFDFVLSADDENDKYARQIRSSAGIAVFMSERDDKRHWVEAGRRYQRFALQATALGIRNAFLNQPVEVAALRPRLASHLGLGGRRPDLVVRFGYGAEMPRSLRRPVEAVIV